MIGIIVELLVSWLLLWLYDKKNLSVFGLYPSKDVVRNLLFGFSAATLCCAAYLLLIAAMTKTDLSLNNEFTILHFISSLWWTIKSVVFEELIFRGALLYIAIHKVGIKSACIVSAIFFGIYHWFSYEIFGDPMQMAIIFFLTGIPGLMFAYAFALTRSLYLPIGLHLGWNLTSIVVFSQGPLGQQLLIGNNGQPLGGVLSVVFILYQIFVLPFVTLLYLRRQNNNLV